MPLPPRKKAPAKRRAAPKKSAAKRKPAPKRKVQKKSLALTTIRQQNLGQQTESKVSLRAGRPDSRAAMMKAVSTVAHYVDTGSGIISTEGSNGRQAWQQTSISSQVDLQEMAVLMVPRTQPGSQVPPARYLLQKCHHVAKFSNVGQATVRLHIMHVRAKRDLYKTMDYTTPNGFIYSWDGTPGTAVQQGISAAGTGPLSGGLTWLVPGVDETESPIFNSYFNVIKRTTVLLAIGGTHRLDTHVAYDRVLDATVYGNEASSGISGVTDFLLFKAEGQTGVITTEDPPRVTIAPCQVVYTENWDYSYTQLSNARQFLDTFDPITSDANVVQVISASTGSGLNAVGLVD